MVSLRKDFKLLTVAKLMSNRNKGTMETNRFSTLLGEGASALFLLFLAAVMLVPETLGHSLVQVLRLMIP
jgi:hypothetical protein